MDITQLYRDIGKTFREMGADKIVIISSKNYSNTPNCTMSMDMILSGDIIRADIEKCAAETWSFIEMHFQYLEDDTTGTLLYEMVDDGIWL